MRAAQAFIDLNAIQHNLQRVRSLAPRSQILAVVKADAYGHGIVPVARSLEGADALAVACLEEAIQLRQGGVELPVVLLEGFFEAAELAPIQAYGFQTVIHNHKQLEQLDRYQGVPLKVWLKIDTGMHRLGFAPEEALGVLKRLQRLKQVADVVLMSHFACADEPQRPETARQLECFAQLSDSFVGLRSLANSAGVLAFPDSHLDWVRPGLLLYGCSPLPGDTAANHSLKPAMTLQSELIAVKPIPKGDSVGYGANWQASQDTTIGIVAVGYGDGYPRHARNGTPVWLNGRQVPLAGRVSMDMIAVDLGPDANDAIGDKVVLWGPELPVETVAQWADTIPYTLLCGVTSRVRFKWL